MKYETKGAMKFAERDVFADGCIAEGAYSTFVDYTMQADSIDAILNSIADFVGCDKSSIEVNACDELGRIDAATMETAEGYAATPNQIERWKTGNCDLWYCVYSFYFDEVTRKSATFETTGAHHGN